MRIAVRRKASSNMQQKPTRVATVDRTSQSSCASPKEVTAIAAVIHDAMSSYLVRMHCNLALQSLLFRRVKAPRSETNFSQISLARLVRGLEAPSQDVGSAVAWRHGVERHTLSRAPALGSERPLRGFCTARVQTCVCCTCVPRLFRNEHSSDVAICIRGAPRRQHPDDSSLWHTLIDPHPQVGLADKNKESVEALAAELGDGRAHAVPCDVTSRESVGGAVAE